MKTILTLFCISLLFSSCERQHYGCICYHPTYTEDYGTHFTTRESKYKSACESHKVDANTDCQLITNY